MKDKKQDTERISIESNVIEKVLLELKEIRDFFPEDTLKVKIDNVMHIISKATNYSIEDKALVDIIYDKMKEAEGKNPELNTKLYMLYRSLSDGKTSEEDANQLFEIYIQMYPYDDMIY
ncbi:hypothetical protein RBU49_09895 [Clostridium sp. MB40-C1]|uniref:hypothetical protein n=1 Tax=Clostridium sp. MB40-C1 TaxID=3070996 RepID=UPI0027E11AB8|nr:hypothetical protein [Clostridium sp. MB40-C1]WMJ79201.1 hypothetical protein RBU49_09895 [Clostridium sp. MB40-C1]